MEPWIEALTKFGLPVVGIAAFVLFFARSVWPWMVLQVEKTQASRERDLDRFSAQIGDIGKDQTEQLERVSDGLKKVSDGLDKLNDEIRDWRRDKK